MRDISFLFFLAAVLCLTAGMMLGLYMAASDNHTLAGAAIARVAVMVPRIAVATAGGSPGPAIPGSFLVFTAMPIILFTVIRHLPGSTQRRLWTATRGNSPFEQNGDFLLSASIPE